MSTKTRSPPKLFISLHASILPSLFIFDSPSSPSSSHQQLPSLACSAIGTKGRAPSHWYRTSSFPQSPPARNRPFPLSLNSSISLGSSVLVLSSLSVLSPFHHRARNFPISLLREALPLLLETLFAAATRSLRVLSTLHPACATLSSFLPRVSRDCDTSSLRLSSRIRTRDALEEKIGEEHVCLSSQLEHLFLELIRQ